ncbi:MAG: OmpA family protein [Candidatus Korobacteraceae bacterium]|jgi:outer membrane protein OmpA-like peptidoglycan-associated protein
MTSRIGVVPRHFIAAAFALCLFATYATAQVAIQPKDEVFGGYSWLGISGTADFNVKVPDISTGFDASTTYYLPQAHNLGLIADGSGHFDRDHQYVGVGFALFGLQYKYHTDSFSPFVRVMVGFANLSPAYPPTSPNGNNEWQAALSAGGGFDYAINHRFSLRIAQADYIYTNYKIYCSGVLNFVCVPSNQTSQWNNIRLATGVVFNLGNYYTAPLSAACTAQPSEVTEGEPVTVTATGSNFNPKHTVGYAWTTNGGKLDSSDKQSARIDTTGVAAGSYSANATISDAKMRKGGSATCAASFTVKAKPMNPPQVSCSANPSTVQSGSPSSITASASSPDNAQITGYSYTASAGRVSGTGTTATLDTAGLGAGPVSVTVTATDARNLTGNGTCTVNVEVPPPPPACSKINSIQFPDLKHPWRVDNTAKAILDDVASKLKNDPNAKIVIVGYADGEKAPMEGTGKNRHPMNLAAQRAVNAKAYLVQQQGIDPSRVEVRQGTGQQKVADIIWVPQGSDENACADLQNTTPVDESVVKPSENAYPKPRAAAPMHHHKKAAGTAPAAAPQQ